MSHRYPFDCSHLNPQLSFELGLDRQPEHIFSQAAHIPHRLSQVYLKSSNGSPGKLLEKPGREGD